MGIFTQRLLYRAFLALVSVMVFGLGEVRGQTTLVEWNFPTVGPDVIADGGIPINSTQIISTVGGTGAITFPAGFTTQSASATGWDNGNASKSWDIVVNTQGFSNITLSSRQQSSNTGPRNFKVQYCIDGGSTWIDVPSGTITVANNFTAGVLVNLPLPAICSNQVVLQLRWIMTTNTSVTLGTVAPAGTSRIDDIIIQGAACDLIVSSFVPISGPVGTQVTISGLGFTGASDVQFSGFSASFTVVNDNTITATVPFILASGPITVVGASCTGASTIPFQVINICAGNGSNLIISELCDPQNNYQTSRYIEIYNPTSNSILLTGWRVVAISNGVECFTWNLIGSIAPAQAITCGNNNPANGGPHTFGDAAWDAFLIGSCCYNWNGQNDGAALYNGATLIDLAQNLASWFVNSSLIRNSDVCNPSTSTILSQWSTIAVTYAGTAPSTPRSHTSSCTGTPPTIDTQPTSLPVCETSPIILSVTASGGTPPYSYQWKFHNGTDPWQNVVDGGAYSGATTSSLTITADMSINGFQYYCEVSNSGGTCFKASNAVQLTVNPLPVLTAPASVCVGNTINLTPVSGGTWSSSNTAIATVTNSGLVTGIAAGNAIFTFTETTTGCMNSTSPITINALPTTSAIYHQ